MMNFRLFCVLTLCIWLEQICAANDERIDEVERLIRGNITAVGEQFVDDFVTISERNRNNLFISALARSILDMLGKEIPKEKNSKIDVNQVKDYLLDDDLSSFAEKQLCDYLKIMQSILSKQFPQERYNGIINLLFACSSTLATTEEIQSALNYLYGADIEATKTSFMDSHNLPKLTSKGYCPRKQRLSPITNGLSRLVDVKPKVKEDFLAVEEQFPCNTFAFLPLEQFVRGIERFGGRSRKVNACMIKEYRNRDPHGIKTLFEELIETSESIFSIRLPDETFRGVINFLRAIIPGTPTDEIEQALEYVYDDVPKGDCETP